MKDDKVYQRSLLWLAGRRMAQDIPSFRPAQARKHRV